MPKIGRIYRRAPRPGVTRITFVAFGDSTTAARGPVQIYLDCLTRDLPQNGIEIDAINAGVPGDTTEAARRRFAKDVLDRHPDIVVIQFGINDSAIDVWQKPPATSARVTTATYTGNLEYFVATLQKHNCRVILMTPNPMRWTSALMKMYGKPPYRPDDLDGFNVMLRAYAGCVRDVARKYTVPVVDVYAAFQRYGKDRGKSIDNLLLDGMHPNDRGHRLVADLLIKAILKKVSATDQQGRVDARPARAIH